MSSQYWKPKFQFKRNIEICKLVRRHWADAVPMRGLLYIGTTLAIHWPNKHLYLYVHIRLANYIRTADNVAWVLAYSNCYVTPCTVQVHL